MSTFKRTSTIAIIINHSYIISGPPDENKSPYSGRVYQREIDTRRRSDESRHVRFDLSEERADPGRIYCGGKWVRHGDGWYFDIRGPQAIADADREDWERCCRECRRRLVDRRIEAGRETERKDGYKIRVVMRIC